MIELSKIVAGCLLKASAGIVAFVAFTAFLAAVTDYILAGLP